MFSTTFTQMKFLITTGVLIVQTIAYAQEPQYSAGALKSDFALFRDALQEAHPSLYRFHSKLEMDKLFDHTLLSLNQPMGELEFYKKLAAITSKIGCGHTRLKLSEAYLRNHPVNSARFPFDVRFVEGKLFVVKSFVSDHEPGPGWEIISVDKTSISTLVDTFFPLMNGDGFITSSKYKRLEQYFGRYIQTLYKEAPSYQIEFINVVGQHQTKSIKLVPTSNLQDDKERPGLDFKIINLTQVAILTIRTFESDAKDANGVPYPEFLKSCFSSLKENKIQSLIIDLRGNGGGRDDYGSLLYGLLTNKPYRYYDYLEMKKPEYSFLKYTDRDDSYKNEIRNMLVQQKDGKWVRKDSSHPCLVQQQPQPGHFDNRVFVLIDGNSFSATAEFASITSFHERALFIGEESGGALEGNTSGGGITLTLPNTKLTVNIPLNKYVCSVIVKPEQVGRGIIPNQNVSPTLQGILAGRDEVMEEALRQAK